MRITFINHKHETLATNHEALGKKYNKKGEDWAHDIIDSINVLAAAESLYDVPRSYHPHPLKAEYKGCFAIDVTDKHRLIFKPDHDNDPEYRIDNYKTIKAIIIFEIFKDYH
jgi:mRNA-degrading endonuclease YafQ of YafQ-DinJ toxin-antitoxin module